MANIRSLKEIAEKFTRVTPARSADYEAGVKNPIRDWEKGALEANSSWKGGVQRAVQRDAFAQGVRKARTEKWQRKAVEVGVSRWSDGVSRAGADYEAGFAPYHAVIEKTPLPPRYPKGDPRNIERVIAIAKALREAKERGG